MTRAQLDALPGKAGAVVIVPTGAVEQHGPHLPVGVDALLGQAFLAAALAHVPAEVPVYVGPSLTYGKSNEHAGFPGTIALSARTFRRLLVAVARQLHALGFRTLAVFNTHGGNSTVLEATLRELQGDPGLNACRIAPAWNPPLAPQEAAFGFHAGQEETAWMLAIAPHLVRSADAPREFPARLEDPGALRPVGAPAPTFGWLSSDLSRSGAMGDATAATAADGRAWLDAGARSLAAEIVRLAGRVAAG